MKERPILFSGPMVRAILEGRKTQTRRIFKFQEANQPPSCPEKFNPVHVTQRCPYGVPGDRLWVRETWAPHADMSGAAIYRCDRGGDYQDTVTPNFRWRPSIHMPRWASRITLEITAVRVERLQDIREKGASAEGVNWGTNRVFAFLYLWDSIYGNWEANPYVWVISFKRVEGGAK